MIRVRDLDLYFETHGRSDAEPLVLLHGFTGTGQETFGPFIDQLGEYYRLIIPDWRGHGRTTNPSGEIVHSELARDTAAFVTALGLTRAHFCGHSSGAMLLLFLALERPDLVHSLTLVSGTYTFDDHVKAQVREIMTSVPLEWTEYLKTWHGETHGPNYAHIIVNLWADSVLRPDELPFTPDDLGKITCPTLIIHGDRDSFFPVYVPVTMYQAIPNAELCILPKCGHGVPPESPTLFVTALLQFLTQNPFVRSSR
ncbi:MAG: alpha/beta hydrolase [Anaerolineae bacterium]|nr:alpha/beta hydrolase [Anaerolineae bacterium]